MMAIKILAADSSPSALKAIFLACQDSDCDVFTFQDGNELMDALPQVDPDAFILGLSLPEKDVYEIARYLKNLERFKDSPIILLQSAYEKVDKTKLIGLKYDEIVQKPFDSEKLVQKIIALEVHNEYPRFFTKIPIILQN